MTCMMLHIYICHRCTYTYNSCMCLYVHVHIYTYITFIASTGDMPIPQIDPDSFVDSLQLHSILS